MKNIFTTVQTSKPKTNTFDLTHDVKMSGRMGDLMPIMNMECVPGDRVTISADTLIRFAPLLAPVMHRVDVSIHYFFCPSRLIWPNFEKFITNQTTGGLPLVLISTALSTGQQKFLDYFGIPPITGTSGFSDHINALPLMAYQKIYNDYYRDQNLVADLAPTLVDGVNSIGIMATMRRRAWEHDYFTSCLPTAQTGNAVSLPLGDVTLKNPIPINTIPPQFKYRTTGGVAGPGAVFNEDSVTPFGIEDNVNPNIPLAYDPAGTLSVGATTINDLRRAFKLQQWLEKTMRGGRRYIEHIKMMFGVTSSDKRLDRPEYITGVKTPVIISEVLNTTGTTGQLPQGNMAGHAVSVGTGQPGSFFCEEHGYIIGILSVMPKSGYHQGMPRHFIKTDPMDWFWPDFANLGEQEVKNKELFAYESSATRDATFGYIPRYAEYKYIPSRVAGDFRSTLSFWHLSRIFATQPALNQTFIEMDPTASNRIFAVNGATDNLYMHILNKVRAARPMPVFGTPQL